MGAWIAGTLIVSVVATENFYTVDRLLAGSSNDAFRSIVDRLGTSQTRELLRYLSSELNRLYFQLWNYAQLAIGALVYWLLRRTAVPARVRLSVIGLLGSVVLMTVWLTPEITSVGRALDFVPRTPPPPELRRFWMLHATYTGLEMSKLVIGVLATVWIHRSAAAEFPPRRSTTPAA